MNREYLFSGEPIPGERWALNREIVHCLSMALDRIRLYLSEDDAQVVYWLGVFRVMLRSGIAATIRPVERDRGFFEALIASERWFLFEKHQADDTLPCGHTVDAHQQALQLWAEEFLAAPKRLCAASLAAVDLLSQETRARTTRCLTRKDAVRIAESKAQEFAAASRKNEERMREQLRREGHPEAAVERIVRHAVGPSAVERAAKLREAVLRRYEPHIMGDIPARGWLT